MNAADPIGPVTDDSVSAALDKPRWTTLRETFFRFAATGYVPSRWFAAPPDRASLAGRTGALSLEIVSHCWQYSHLLAVQLASLRAFPPMNGSVRMTVWFAPEDAKTAALLEWFGAIEVPGVEWNWRPIERERLMRRAIGRNLSARATEADWVWFTDCDVLFLDGCLDALFERLQGCREPLVYPRWELRTPLLPDDHPLLRPGAERLPALPVDRSLFREAACHEAKGPYQITHGDVARSLGYCDGIAVYHEPSHRWRKCHEDRVFRWLIATRGTALDIPGVHRIRHASKGRYHAGGWLRGMIRRFESAIRDRRAGAERGR